MKIEDQVVSLEIAMKLKELGAKQDSLYYFYENNAGNRQLIYNYTCDGFGRFFSDGNQYSAFTVAELGEMLPENVKIIPMYIEGITVFLWESVCSIILNKGDCKLHTPNGDIIFNDKKEADSRGKMLIYLLENELIKLEDINGN